MLNLRAQSALWGKSLMLGLVYIYHKQKEETKKLPLDVAQNMKDIYYVILLTTIDLWGLDYQIIEGK